MLLLMAGQVLEGPKDEGRAGYQVAMSVCLEGGGGTIEARGERVQVGADVVEMACCEAQHNGDVGQRANVGRAMTHVGRTTQEIPPALRRQVMRRASAPGHGFTEEARPPSRREGGTAYQ